MVYCIFICDISATFVNIDMPSTSAEPPIATTPEKTRAASEPSSPCLSPSVNANWSADFAIPWHKTSHTMMSMLRKGKRPTPKERRGLVRVIAEAVHQQCHHPQRRQLSRIAESVVRRYPDSLEDRIAGDIVGCGYHSLLNQLVCRLENINRGSPLHAMKRKSKLLRPTKHATDCYGCVNWLPDAPPEGETVSDQEEKRQRLVTLADEGVSYDETVTNLMNETYYQQRLDIVGGLATPDLVQRWPYLFAERGMAGHSKTLLGVDVTGQIGEFVASKGKLMKNFFLKSSTKKASTRIFEEETALEQTDISSGQCMTAALILAVMAEFEEACDLLFVEMEVCKYALVFINIMCDLICTQLIY